MVVESRSADPRVGLSSTPLPTGAAPLLEVFASIQGEGTYVGQPQTFVRLRGCPLRCRYCDTPGSWDVARAADARSARLVPAEGPVRQVEPDATAFQALCWIAEAEGGRPRTISVTGGEPLLWPDFVIELARLAGERHLHLETAGAHPDALERVLPSVHHLSLDLKLPATLDAPVDRLGETALPAGTEAVPRDAAGWRQVRRRALGLAQGRDAVAKLVLTDAVPLAELTEALDDVAEAAPDVPVVLQPATPVAGTRPASAELLERGVETALDRELRVLVLPQVHRALGVR